MRKRKQVIEDFGNVDVFVWLNQKKNWCGRRIPVDESATWTVFRKMFKSSTEEHTRIVQNGGMGSVRV